MQTLTNIQCDHFINPELILTFVLCHCQSISVFIFQHFPFHIHQFSVQEGRKTNSQTDRIAGIKKYYSHQFNSIGLNFNLLYIRFNTLILSVYTHKVVDKFSVYTTRIGTYCIWLCKALNIVCIKQRMNFQYIQHIYIHRYKALNIVCVQSSK